MKKWVGIAAIVAGLACSPAAFADDGAPGKIGDKEQEFNKAKEEGSAENSDDGLGGEGLKPVTEVDPMELINQILKRMEKSETDILSASASASTGGLQEEIVQGLNRVQGNIVRDLNKLVDYAKMTKP